MFTSAISFLSIANMLKIANKRSSFCLSVGGTDFKKTIRLPLICAIVVESCSSSDLSEPREWRFECLDSSSAS